MSLYGFSTRLDTDYHEDWHIPSSSTRSSSSSGAEIALSEAAAAEEVVLFPALDAFSDQVVLVAAAVLIDSNLQWQWRY